MQWLARFKNESRDACSGSRFRHTFSAQSRHPARPLERSFFVEQRGIHHAFERYLARFRLAKNRSGVQKAHERLDAGAVGRRNRGGVEQNNDVGRLDLVDQGFREIFIGLMLVAKTPVAHRFLGIEQSEETSNVDKRHCSCNGTFEFCLVHSLERRLGRCARMAIPGDDVVVARTCGMRA